MFDRVSVLRKLNGAAPEVEHERFATTSPRHRRRQRVLHFFQDHFYGSKSVQPKDRTDVLSKSRLGVVSQWIGGTRTGLYGVLSKSHNRGFADSGSDGSDRCCFNKDSPGNRHMSVVFSGPGWQALRLTGEPPSRGRTVYYVLRNRSMNKFCRLSCLYMKGDRCGRVA